MKLGKIISHSTFYCIIFSISIFLKVFPELIHASQTQGQLALNFDSKLKKTTKNLVLYVLGSKKKVVITVIDILNYESQGRDSMTFLLEEKITDSLYKKLPDQVVPYFEIVYLRLEWRNTFPEIKHDPLTEDLAKLTSADWLLTGTHQKIEGALSVDLELYDLESGDLLWKTIVGKDSLDENDLEEKKIRIEEESKQQLMQSISVFPQQNYTKIPRPIFPLINKEKFLEPGKLGENKNNTESVMMIEPIKEGHEIPEGMVIIKEGEFLMGSNLGSEDELPDHLVFVKSFFLDQYEVTNADYNECLKCISGNGGFDTIELQQPVVYVDWENADAYCKFKNKRLPKESEWEYAARAGSNKKYSFGDNLLLLEIYAWMKTNTEDKGHWGAKTVGSRKANKWGLYDMHGNVMEWVQNYYMPNYFSSVRQSNNSDYMNVIHGNEKYPLRVVRGGAWGGLHEAGTPEGLRASKRYAFVEWTRSFQIGFRCAKDIP